MPESNVITLQTEHDPVLDSVIRCHRTELKSVDDMSVRDLFSGFDTLRAITFSASADFVNRLVGLFGYAEIIFGAEFLLRKNAALHDASYQAFAGAHLVKDIPEKYRNIGDRMRAGAFVMRTPNICLDHRKVYILSSKAGRTRVIIASANMSGKAWNGEHIELYERDESRYSYDTWMNLFDAAWSMSVDVPYQAAGVDKDDIINGNVVIRKAIETNNMLVLPAQEEAVTREMVEYVVRYDQLTDEYRDAFANVMKLKGVAKKGVFNLLPKHIEKADAAYRRALKNRRVEMQFREQDYPGMKFIYNGAESAMYVDEKPVDLNPNEADVRADIENLLTIFGNFDDGGSFIGNLAGLRRNHYKFLIYMLMAPHIAKLRCVARANGFTLTSLPLFVILTSRHADTGKTLMAQAVLALMTGKALEGEKGDGEGVSERIRVIQTLVRCTPYLFDEVSAKSFSTSIKAAVKNADWCERYNRDQQPVIMLTSNEMSDPDDIVRKRSVHLLFDAALRSDVDRNALGNTGNKLKKKFTGAFYREFCRRALPRVSDMIDYMWSEDEKPDTWYPDVVDLSSEIFLDIMSDYGYDVPEYMTKLKWNEDYFAPRKACEDTVREIQELYGVNPGIFRFDGDQVSISLGSDSSKQKLMKSWYNTLPPEANADCYMSMQTGAVLTMDLKELEKLGFRRRRGLRRLPLFRGRKV